MKIRHAILYYALIIVIVIGCEEKTQDDIASYSYESRIKYLESTIDSIVNVNEQLIKYLPYPINKKYQNHISHKKEYSFKSIQDDMRLYYGIADLKDSVIVETKYVYTKILSQNLAALNKENKWQIIDCRDQTILLDSLYGVSEFQNGISAIMTCKDSIYFIDTLCQVVDKFDNSSNYNEVLSYKEMSKIFSRQLLPQQNYYDINDYIDHKVLSKDSQRFAVHIGPRGEGSSSFYVQRLKYGMRLDYRTGWENFSYHFFIPHISKIQAFLLALKLNVPMMEKINNLDFCDGKIEMKFYDGYNTSILQIKEVDSVFVEIYLENH